MAATRERSRINDRGASEYQYDITIEDSARPERSDSFTRGVM